MEYPKLNTQLHLLMLMHQQLEEARALGYAEPRLEYREDSAGLTTRVVGVDAVGEICYGGGYHADELVEGAGEPLRRLSADGCVELHHGDAGPSSGTVIITEEGLKKIRYRRNFEASMPRSLKMWEISLLGAQEIRHMRLWRATWEGRQITVRNRRSLRLQTPPERAKPLSEYLNVDNRFPAGYRVEKSRFAKDLYGELRAVDGTHEVHAHIGLTTPLLRTACLITVDGVVMGGDVGKKFLT